MLRGCVDASKDVGALPGWRWRLALPRDVMIVGDPLPIRCKYIDVCFALRPNFTFSRGHYVGIHSSGFRDFLLKPQLVRAIVDCGFEHPSEGESGAPCSPLFSLSSTWYQA